MEMDPNYNKFLRRCELKPNFLVLVTLNRLVLCVINLVVTCKIKCQEWLKVMPS